MNILNDTTLSIPMMRSVGIATSASADGASKADTSREAENLRKACRDFESVFMRILLREMRKTVPEGGVFALSSSSGMYRDIADDFFAQKLADSGGMGLGNVLFKELGRALAAQNPATIGTAQSQPTIGDI